MWTCTFAAKVSSLVQFERPKKVIDLTTKTVMVSTLEEAVIQCLTEEKVPPPITRLLPRPDPFMFAMLLIIHFLQDYYLYYFTQQHKGRTLVFCNSISCIRRLIPILNLLKVPAYGLHASMQQRQRLKNLDRWVSSLGEP